MKTGLVRDEQCCTDTMHSSIEENVEAISELSSCKRSSDKQTSLIFLTMAGEIFSLSNLQEQIAEIGNYNRYSS